MAREYTQEHIMKLCLPPELYLAVAKFQVQKEIGKSYAGLLLVTKALYQEKLISKEIYEKFLYRYSRKLVPEDQPEKMTAEQLREKQKLIEKARTFSMLASQWDYIPAQNGDKNGSTKQRSTKTQFQKQKLFWKKFG
jgi:hypothetical protein